MMRSHCEHARMAEEIYLPDLPTQAPDHGRSGRTEVISQDTIIGNQAPSR